MKITRRFTEVGQDVFDSVEWTSRSSRIMNLDGSVVFEMTGARVPKAWSQLATDIMVSKYFRKAGVPQVDPENGQLLKDENGQVITGPERSVRQVIHRLVDCWRQWGERNGYFDTSEDAQAFYDELAHMMLYQMCAPNSPQWFNTGLNSAYGINGPAQGHYYTDAKTGETKRSEDAYSRPQPSACFIQSIDDDLVGSGGIMDLWVREARLFKYGSGTGTNFSKLRAEDEPLSGGGRSSGLMSFLKIGDRAAGAIKSGGTTRRAAKMVCLDMDHPDIEAFVTWKVREELKVAAMVEGRKRLMQEQAECADRLGLDLDYDFNGEAYQTVSGQNSNNSVRIPNRFFTRLAEDGEWDYIRRTDGKIAQTVRARDLWDKITEAAWHCADPGVQFDSTINEWHTCPSSGRINASNPCSEYVFLDDTACNLASLNLIQFYEPRTRCFDLDGFEHAIRLWTIVLEISVLMAQYPSKQIARLSYEYRTLGLGYANLGAMLMQAGIPYDSERARALCGCITAILTGRSYATSAEMAAHLGPFPSYSRNQEHMLRVIRNHRRAAYGVSRNRDESAEHNLGGYEGLEIVPVPIHADAIEGGSDGSGNLANVDRLLQHAKHAWDDALVQGEQHGYRNAQVTVIAPTGTIGLLMDCDTTGVEPDFALVKFKKLAGGGYFKIANQSLAPALAALGYDTQQVKDMLTYVMGTLSLDVPFPGRDHELFSDFLRDMGLTDEDLKKVTDALPTVFELHQAFGPWTLGPDCMQRLDLVESSGNPGAITAEDGSEGSGNAEAIDGNMLKALGLSTAQIKQLNLMICGTQTVENAPHLLSAHLPVFDCANRCGPTGNRFIAAEGHIRMMAAAQPFISGAISKTINLPHEASREDIGAAYRLSWELCLKANAVYRDGCKLSQVLNSSVDADELPDDEDNLEAGHEEVAENVAEVAGQVSAEQSVEKIVERIVERPLRRRLPDTRLSKTHKFNVAGHEGYLTVGLYDDGSPGELFITMAKEGSTIGGLMDSLGTAISVALQYGVPVESLVNKFTHQRFEPAGMTHNRDIPFAKSLVDYIFRWMGMEFVGGYREANSPRLRDSTPDTPHAESRPKAGAAARPVPNSDGGNGANGNLDRLGSHQAASVTESDQVESSGRNSLEVRAPRVAIDAASPTKSPTTTDSAVSTALNQLQTDAPTCDVCGTITVRSGTCYKCLNCGNSMGCS